MKLTDITVVSPASSGKNAVSETMGNPEKLLYYPRKQYSQDFIDATDEE